MSLKSYLLFLLSSISLHSQDIPQTKKVNKTIIKFNHEIKDEYAWLENYNAEEVKKWVLDQNTFSNANYSKVKKKVSTANKLKIYNQETTDEVPIDTKGYKYGLVTVNPNKSPYLFMQKTPNTRAEEILNPNKIYPNKNVNIDNFSNSASHKYVSCALRINGSDKLEVRFIDLKTYQLQKDSLTNVKFSKLSWKKDEGIFYKLNLNKLQFAKDSTYKVYYHKLNTKQEDDVLVYDGKINTNEIDFFSNKSMFILSEKNSLNNITKYFYADLEKEKFELKQFKEDTYNLNIIDYYKGKIYYSSLKNNWGEIRAFDLKNKEDDKQIIPQFYGQLLTETHFTDNYLICCYKTENKTHITIFDYDGKQIKKIESPNGTYLDFRYFDKETEEIYFNVYSYIIPTKNFKIKLSETKPKLLNPIEEVVYPSDDFEVKALTYKNREGINVPIKIAHKKGIKLDGQNPCLLEAYGGFGIIDNPSYNNSLMNFLNKGGVYAFAEIRGGGEKGISWHSWGSGKNKINGLNDFVDASEFLIKENYTNPQKLAITGASHGGLVVGYALTERPDLYKLALPKVGVFDMINMHQYTVGKYHLDEFGNPDIETDFNAILKYSPLHKIKKEINYPTTIIFTSDNDDRVPPIHSFKFAASLQNREAQKNPIFLVTKQNLGHYGGNTYNKKIYQDAEFYDYLIYYLMKS